MVNRILISACLMGLKVRYNGSEKAPMMAHLLRWQKEQRLVIHCPELAAGLPIPRSPAEIFFADGKDVMRERARIIENTGNDVTEHYQLAAWLALRTAQESGCTAALLTDGSPTWEVSLSMTALLVASVSLVWESQHRYLMSME